MIKPTKNFKMPKYVKTLMCRHLDAHKRGEFKRSMIQALLEAEASAKKPIKENIALSNVPDLEE